MCNIILLMPIGRTCGFSDAGEHTYCFSDCFEPKLQSTFFLLTVLKSCFVCRLIFLALPAIFTDTVFG